MLVSASLELFHSLLTEALQSLGKELSPQESNNVPRFVAVFAIPHRQSVPELCLQVLQAIFRI